MAKDRSLKEKLERLGKRSEEAEEKHITSSERLEDETKKVDQKKAATEKEKDQQPSVKERSGAKGKKENISLDNYEDFFKKNTDLEDQRMIKVALYEDVHRKLSQLITIKKNSTKTSLVNNILLDWFERHGKEIKKDKKDFLDL